MPVWERSEEDRLEAAASRLRPSVVSDAWWATRLPRTRNHWLAVRVSSGLALAPAPGRNVPPAGANNPASTGAAPGSVSRVAP
jgi:hypothetical protein